jgi:GTP pyrophosphokinase
MTTMLFLITAVFLPLLVNEFSDWCPRLAQRLVRWSAHRLRDPDIRARYQEEYLANLARVPGGFSQLLAALGYAANVVAMRRTLHPTAALDALILIHRAAYPNADPNQMRSAYGVAEERHRGQRRVSGDPYITHPVAVAAILAEVQADTSTLVAALLHDTIEDTDYSVDALARRFGTEVAQLVSAVTALSGHPEPPPPEYRRTLADLTCDDPRTVLIKLADRLHNLRTISVLPPAKQVAVARHTLEVLVPVARLLASPMITHELQQRAHAILCSFPSALD